MKGNYMREKMMLCLLIILLTGGLFWPTCGQATEKEGKPLVIGVLIYSKNNLQALAAFKAGLHERGYVEGQGG